MNKNENIKVLVEQLTKENEELKKYIMTIEEQLCIYKKEFGDGWVHAKLYNESIKELKKAKREYDEAKKEMLLIQDKYKKELDKLVDNFVD